MRDADAADKNAGRAVDLASAAEGGFGGLRIGDVAGDREPVDSFADDADAFRVDVDGGDFGARFRKMSGRLRPEPGCRTGDHNRALPQIHSFVSEMCVGAFGPLGHNLSIGETGEHSIKSPSLAQSGVQPQRS